MFGSLLTVTDEDLLVLLVVGLGLFAVLAWYYNDILLDSLSSTLAHVRGVRTAFIEYLFVVLLTLAIVVSLKVIGALLVEALVVVPAASARNLARTMRGYLIWSIAIALAGCISGLTISTKIAVPSGGAVVLALSMLFFITLITGGIARRLGSRPPPG